MLTTTLRIDAHGIPNRFKVWELYFTIRSSKQFIQNWVTFLSLMKVSPTPVLYQHLTVGVFKSLIHSKLLFRTQKSADEETLMVTQVEANCICVKIRSRLRMTPCIQLYTTKKLSSERWMIFLIVSHHW